MSSVPLLSSVLSVDRLLVVAHAGVTLAMVGVIWMVQLVVYPQFRVVDADNFSAYVGDHSVRISIALALFAPAEVLLALALWLRGPFELSSRLTFVAGLLLAVLWISTALYYGPYHGRLQRDGFELASIDRLIVTNWLRTILWTARGGLALWFLLIALDRAPTSGS